jgi:hypothetical protein
MYRAALGRTSFAGLARDTIGAAQKNDAGRPLPDGVYFMRLDAGSTRH